MIFALILILIVSLVEVADFTTQKAQRRPLQKKELRLVSPAKYEQRIVRYDAQTGEPIYYDPKPQVVLLDAKSGKYALKWIGYDRQEKTIIYQRPDAIDVVVSASVTKTASGQFQYIYTLENLPSSGQHLSIFAIQTFASDVKLIPIGEGYVGAMTNNQEMKEGNWFGFGSSNFQSTVLPGKKIELRIESPSPPSLVECRVAGGVLGMKGVGEELPQELENVLLGYEAWPRGHTLGPVDRLKNLSQKERAEHLLKLLPEFQKLGWITSRARRWYERELQRSTLGKIYYRADQDLRSGNITTEVHDMIQAIRE